MKKIHLLAATLVAVSSLSSNASAHEEKPTPAHHTAPTNPSAGATSVPSAWSSITTGMAAAEKMIAASNLKPLHEQEESITAGLQYLSKHSPMVEGDKKMRLDSVLKQALNVTSSLHEASDQGDQAKTQSEFKKLQGALRLVEAQYPSGALTSTSSPAEKSCPVSGKALGSMGDPYVHPYEMGGMKAEVQLCCSGCVTKFDKDPSKYQAAATKMEHGEGHQHGETEPTIVASATTIAPLTVGQKAEVTLKLANKDGSPVRFEDLEVAHTQRIHVLLIDSSLSDYHHEHPTATDVPGAFRFSFSPKKPGSYRLWADLLPVATKAQEYAMTDIAGAGTGEAITDRESKFSSTADGLTFALSFDKNPIKAGDAAMGKIIITEAGKPYTQLEPVMGAFAHIVGFSEDYKTIAHVHPMGKEPTMASERGGPELEFHLEPASPGLLRLFVQVQKGGKNVFAPLTVDVK